MPKNVLSLKDGKLDKLILVPDSDQSRNIIERFPSEALHILKISRTFAHNFLLILFNV